MVFAQTSPKSPVLPEGVNPPVIISQVELSTQFKFLPNNQTCTSPPKSGFTNNCLTDLVPSSKVACGYFLGSSTCEPIHINNIINSCIVADGFYPNGTVVKNTSHEFGEQWVTLYNRLDTSITVSHFEVYPNKEWVGNYYEATLPHRIANPPSIAPYLVMEPHQNCTYGFFAIDEPFSINTENSAFTVLYVNNGTQYQSSTPPLTDNYSDARTWQYDGNKWTFAEQNTVTVPEFPLAVPVLLVSFVSAIVFYRMKFRK